MAQDPSLRVNITADTGGLRTAIAQSERALKDLGLGSAAALRPVQQQIDATAVAANGLASDLAKSIRIGAGAGGIAASAGVDAAMVARFGSASAGLKNVNDNAKLTANQLLNLTRQGGDAATMFAMGASAMSVFTSQAAQVVDSLQSGPGGMRGSLKAIGTGLLGLATPLNLTVVGLTAAAGAAVYFGTRGRDQIKPLNQAMEEHRRIIEKVADTYGVALDANNSYRSGAEAAFAQRRSEAELRMSSRQSLFDTFIDTTKYVRPGRDEEGRDAPRASKQYAAFAEPLLALRQGLKAGKPDAEAFVKAVAEIANANPTNSALQKLADELIRLAEPAAEAKRKLDALAQSRRQLQAGRLTDAMTELRGFLPDRSSERDRIDEVAQRASLAARSYGELMEIERQRKSGLAEIERLEENASQRRVLDLADIQAKTAAEGIDVGRARERFNGIENGASR